MLIQKEWLKSWHTSLKLSTKDDTVNKNILGFWDNFYDIQKYKSDDQAYDMLSGREDWW
jgi:hypothetical protein